MKILNAKTSLGKVLDSFKKSKHSREEQTADEDNTARTTTGCSYRLSVYALVKPIVPSKPVHINDIENQVKYQYPV